MSHVTRTTSHGTQTRVHLSDHPGSVLPVLSQLQISHHNEQVRWALDYKRVPQIRHSLLPGLHIRKAKRLTRDTSTTPVLTIDRRSIGDSTRIIPAIKEGWPQPPLDPEDEAQRHRALELKKFFDERLGPHSRRAVYHELLPHPALVAPLLHPRPAAPAADPAASRIPSAARSHATETLDQRGGGTRAQPAVIGPKRRPRKGDR
jgi:glutathione S-transferase